MNQSFSLGLEWIFLKDHNDSNQYFNLSMSLKDVSFRYKNKSSSKGAYFRYQKSSP